jgi:MFS family permease
MQVYNRSGLHGPRLASILHSPLAGWISDRTGPKVPAVGGLLFSVPFLILLRLPHASEDNQAGQLVLLCALLAFLGLSINAINFQV